MKKVNSILVLLISVFTISAHAQKSYYNPEIPEIVQYKVTADVKYGEGKVKKDGKIAMKDLTMDVYYPAEESNEARPAVILSYGGSFHRGNPRIPYSAFGGQTTTMSQYAMQYAAEGFVVFTINYRVAPDNPVISYDGYSDDDLDLSLATTPPAMLQANTIRRQMGLEDVTTETAAEIMKTSVVAGGEDLRTAIRHIKAEKNTYKIDPNKVAIGGFSAGAVHSMNVVYGLNEEVAAVFTNSGFPSVFKVDQLIDESSSYPPLLAFMSDNDLPVVSLLMPPFMQLLDQKNVEYQFNWVPGFGHFYPGGAVSLSDNGNKMPVVERTIKFLKETMK